MNTIIKDSNQQFNMSERSTFEIDLYIYEDEYQNKMIALLNLCIKYYYSVIKTQREINKLEEFLKYERELERNITVFAMKVIGDESMSISIPKNIQRYIKKIEELSKYYKRDDLKRELAKQRLRLDKRSERLNIAVETFESITGLKFNIKDARNMTYEGPVCPSCARMTEEIVGENCLWCFNNPYFSHGVNSQDL